MDQAVCCSEETHFKVTYRLLVNRRDFPGDPGIKNLPANAEVTGLIPGPLGLWATNITEAQTL